MVPPTKAKMSRSEIEERRTWAFGLPLIAQRARFAAIDRLRVLNFKLTEEQTVDYSYLKEILRM